MVADMSLQKRSHVVHGVIVRHQEEVERPQIQDCWNSRKEFVLRRKPIKLRLSSQPGGLN